MKCPKRRKWLFFQGKCNREKCVWWMKRAMASFDPEDPTKYVGEKDNSNCVMVVIADRMKRF